MKGKLFRSNKDGCLYEVIGQDDIQGAPVRWVLWSEHLAVRVLVSDLELRRQIGWELVGSAKSSAASDGAPRNTPPPLLK